MLLKIKTKIIKFNPEIVIHLAWEGIPVLNYTNCYKNLKNSISFFDLIFRETLCKKIIISGSCLEYGKQYGLCKETSQTKINILEGKVIYCFINFRTISRLD